MGVEADGSIEHCQTTPQHWALSLSNIELFNRCAGRPAKGKWCKSTAMKE